MNFLGNPQEAIRVIHVAGTSGKTSTAYYISALLRANGCKVGLSVSPHIDVVSERVQIDGCLLEEGYYCHALSNFLELVTQSGEELSYFEVLVAFAYWEFSKQGVDYAVIEAGLGGLLDGTNVVSRKDKISVITDIGFDHTEILGNKIEEIAVQKAGIILPNSDVFLQTQSEDIMTVIKSAADTKQAKIHTVKPRHNDLEIPSFQRRNLNLALSVIDYALKHEIDTDTLNKTASVYIPARMEEISYKGHTLVLDGSHNPQKIKALAHAISERYGLITIPLLVSFGQNKQINVQESLAELRKISSDIILTSSSGFQDEMRTAIDPMILRSMCQDLNFTDIIVIKNPVKAFEALLMKRQGIVLVTGSYYLLNHIRPIVWPKH